MVIPLAGRRRWLFFASLIVLSTGYIFLCALQFAASIFASRSDLRSLERAIWLSPGNADYRDRAGRYNTFVIANPQAALADFEAAARLNPYGANYWLDVASARQVSGDSSGQRTALESALRAEPTSPRVAWEAGNQFLIDGDISGALREFRVVIENDPDLAAPALQYCWRAQPDVDVLLHDAVPAHPDSLIHFLELLMSKRETDATLKVWTRLIEQREKFESRYLYGYVNYLVGQRRPDLALASWEQASSLLGLSGYLPTSDNLVINPDFSLDILNGGFDWTYINRTGVRPILDSGDFHAGHRSLSITFEGPGISDAGVQQMIPVHGGTAYEFSAYYKSTAFEGAGGPQLVLRDAYSGTPLWISDPLNDAEFWKETHSRVTTPDTTTLIVVRVERFPTGSPMRGKLWLGSFSLSPADSGERP